MFCFRFKSFIITFTVGVTNVGQARKNPASLAIHGGGGLYAAHDTSSADVGMAQPSVAATLNARGPPKRRSSLTIASSRRPKEEGGVLLELGASSEDDIPAAALEEVTELIEQPPPKQNDKKAAKQDKSPPAPVAADKKEPPSQPPQEAPKPQPPPQIIVVEQTPQAGAKPNPEPGGKPNANELPQNNNNNNSKKDAAAEDKEKKKEEGVTVKVEEDKRLEPKTNEPPDMAKKKDIKPTEGKWLVMLQSVDLHYCPSHANQSGFLGQRVAWCFSLKMDQQNSRVFWMKWQGGDKPDDPNGAVINPDGKKPGSTQGWLADQTTGSTLASRPLVMYPYTSRYVGDWAVSKKPNTSEVMMKPHDWSLLHSEKFMIGFQEWRFEKKTSSNNATHDVCAGSDVVHAIFKGSGEWNDNESCPTSTFDDPQVWGQKIANPSSSARGFCRATLLWRVLLFSALAFLPRSGGRR